MAGRSPTEEGEGEMSEHTAGPWRAQILPVDRVGYKTYDFMRASIVSPCDYGDKRHVVAHIVEIGDETTNDEVSANAQLIAAAKAKSKSVKFGGTNVGGTDSLLIQSLAKAAGVEFNYIAFQGGGEVNAALLGGHIDAMSSNPTEMLPQVEGKTMRMLAVASEKRLAGDKFKDLPTMKELGYNVVFNTHRGITAPAGISPEAVSYYENAFKKLSENAAFKKYIADNDMTPTYLNSVQATKYMNDFADQAAGLLKDLGIVKK